MVESRKDKLTRLKALINGGIEAGQFRPVDADVAVEMATSFLGAMIYIAVFDGHCHSSIKMPLSDEEIIRIAEGALDIFLHGIMNKQ